MSRPTISEAQAWRPDSLRAAADAWDSAATDLSREFDVVVTGLQASHDFWTGNAADAARDRAKSLSSDADALARALAAAAVAARSGAEQISATRTDVLDTVAAVRRLGCTVADDGTVTAPAQPPSALVSQVAVGNADVEQEVLRAGAAKFTEEIVAKLDALGAADAAAARDIEEAFTGVTTPDTNPAGFGDGNPPADWPHMSQDAIATQIAGMTPEQRRKLVEDFPAQVGNTHGVPWDMRIAANRLNVAQVVLDERRNLERPRDEKIRAIMAARYPGWTPDRVPVNMGATADWAALQNDTPRGRRLVTAYDNQVKQRIAFFQGLLDEVPDPTGRAGRVDRKVLAFDLDRSSFIELIGDLDTAKNVGVLVPGFNTTITGSAANTATANRFVQAAQGDLAMITYLGGPFPQGELPRDLQRAADSSYAVNMAPRLVAFSEDVNRVVDIQGRSTGRDIPVTYIGHSYGGSILGTAEAGGLTADKTIYVAAAGSGVGVYLPNQWHNTNPDVERFSMTAPSDPIGWAQAFPYDAHGADPDLMPGVTTLDTGYYDDGRLMAGKAAHADVINAPSDAWRNIFAVLTGQPYTTAKPWFLRWTG